MLNLEFKNGQAPALNDTNMNAIVGAINGNENKINDLQDEIFENEAKISDLETEVKKAISGKIPEEIISEKVDEYIREHNGNLALIKDVTSNWQGKGYNLIPFPYYDGMSKTHLGINYIVNSDGSVSANGTKTSSTISQFYFTYNTKGYKLEGGKKYRLSGCPKNGSSSTYRLRIIFYENDTTTTQHSQLSDYGNGIEFTVPTGAPYVRIMIDLYGASSSYDLVFYPMLTEVSEDGTYPTEYQRYASGNVELTDSVDAIKHGASGGYNLIPFPYKIASGVKSGVNCTVDEDGSIKLNGTNNGTVSDILLTPNSAQEIDNMVHAEVGKTYMLVSDIKGSLPSGCFIAVNGYDNEKYVKAYYNSFNAINKPFTITSEAPNLAIYVSNRSGNVFNNVTVYIMLVEVNADGTYPTEYERWIPSVQGLSDDVNDLKASLNEFAKPSQVDLKFYIASGYIESGKVYFSLPIPFGCKSFSINSLSIVLYYGSTSVNLGTIASSNIAIYEKRIAVTHASIPSAKSSATLQIGTIYSCEY